MANFQKINKHAGWNKGMQVGLFLFSLVEIKVLRQKFLKLIKVQDGISVCRLDFFKNLVRICCMIIWYCRVLIELRVCVCHSNREKNGNEWLLMVCLMAELKSYRQKIFWHEHSTMNINSHFLITRVSIELEFTTKLLE